MHRPETLKRTALSQVDFNTWLGNHTFPTSVTTFVDMTIVLRHPPPHPPEGSQALVPGGQYNTGYQLPLHRSEDLVNLQDDDTERNKERAERLLLSPQGQL